jgi:hypothetical protein
MAMYPEREFVVSIDTTHVRASRAAAPAAAASRNNDLEVSSSFRFCLPDD